MREFCTLHDAFINEYLPHSKDTIADICEYAPESGDCSECPGYALVEDTDE